MKFFIDKNPTTAGKYYLMVYKGHKGEYYLHNTLSCRESAYENEKSHAWHNSIESALEVAKRYMEKFNDTEELFVTFGKDILKKF